MPDFTWVPVEEASARLGLSVATVRRRAKDHRPVRLADGTTIELDHEIRARPGNQVDAFLIRLPAALPEPPEPPEPPEGPQEGPGAAPDPSAAFLAIRGAMEAATAPLERQAASLLAENDRLQQLLREQAASSAEQLGLLAGRLEAARADVEALERRLGEEAEVRGAVLEDLRAWRARAEAALAEASAPRPGLLRRLREYLLGPAN